MRLILIVQEKKKRVVWDSKNQSPHKEGKHESKSKASTFSYLIESALNTPRVDLVEIAIIGDGHR